MSAKAVKISIFLLPGLMGDASLLWIVVLRCWSLASSSGVILSHLRE